MLQGVKNAIVRSAHKAGVQRTQSFAGVRGTLPGGQVTPEKLFFLFLRDAAGVAQKEKIYSLHLNEHRLMQRIEPFRFCPDADRPGTRHV